MSTYGNRYACGMALVETLEGMVTENPSRGEVHLVYPCRNSQKDLERFGDGHSRWYGLSVPSPCGLQLYMSAPDKLRL
jgi:hypothetical protein